MSVSYRVTSIEESDRQVEAFGQLIFTGNYVTGGDSLLNAAGAIAPEVIPPGSPAALNTAGLVVFTNGQSAIKASRPPLVFDVKDEAGLYEAVVVPGSGAFNFKIKWIVVSTGAELAAGAYPAGITAAIYNYLRMSWKKNI